MTEDALELLLLAISDSKARRRLIGRLRPLLVGRPHPQRRLQRQQMVIRRSPRWCGRC